MATVNTWAGAPPSPNGASRKTPKAKAEHRALSDSMDRVLAELKNLRDAARDSSETDDVVHDLRVSIRRCRSIAENEYSMPPNARCIVARPDWTISSMHG